MPAHFSLDVYNPTDRAATRIPLPGGWGEGRTKRGGSSFQGKRPSAQEPLPIKSVEAQMRAPTLIPHHNSMRKLHYCYLQNRSRIQTPHLLHCSLPGPRPPSLSLGCPPLTGPGLPPRPLPVCSHSSQSDAVNIRQAMSRFSTPCKGPVLLSPNHSPSQALGASWCPILL